MVWNSPSALLERPEFIPFHGAALPHARRHLRLTQPEQGRPRLDRVSRRHQIDPRYRAARGPDDMQPGPKVGRTLCLVSVGSRRSTRAAALQHRPGPRRARRSWPAEGRDGCAAQRRAVQLERPSSRAELLPCAARLRHARVLSGGCHLFGVSDGPLVPDLS